MTSYIYAIAAGIALAGTLLLLEPPTPPPAPFSAAVAPVGDSEAVVFAAADQYGVPRNLARAVLTQESGGDPQSTSSAGAAGLMQVMPATAVGIAQELGIASYDLYDPQTNATFGMYYLSQKIARYGVVWGLAAYNWGPGAVDGFLSRHSDLAGADWGVVLACCAGEIPGETQHYVANILAMAAREEETQPVFLPQASAAGGAYLLQGDVGTNVLTALNANDGALMGFTIQPGETWSFGRSIKPISAMGYLPTVCGPAGCYAGGGWCDLSALYVKVADQLGLESSFPAHAGVSDTRFPGILLNDSNDDGDLTIYNPTPAPVTFRASVEGGVVTVEGGRG